jgi:hypothetical protein
LPAGATASAVPTPTVVRSPSVKPTTSSRQSAQQPPPEPTSTPRAPGQRCLPETPRNSATAAGSAPPIYANLEAGNSRNASQVSRLLEEGARLRNSQQENGSGNPPAIPRPAARLSLRQKVI